MIGSTSQRDAPVPRRVNEPTVVPVSHEPTMNGDTALLRRTYETMVRIRVTEERIADLIEAGEIGTPCHLYIGQEAIAAGVCAALDTSDYIWGGHRSHGHYLAKGGSLRAMLAEIFGKATGCSRGRGGSMHLFAGEVGLLGTVPLVTATVPLAVGAALACRLRGDRLVSVAFFGDGAMEEGHFHESFNMAALYRLPVVFVCENNFYASHLQLLERRVADNLDQVARSHGAVGVRVDGNDVMAVYESARDAVARARGGEGPTLIEARTYRWRGHVGPSINEDVGVKRKDELKEWLPRDPIRRVRERLQEAGTTQEYFEQVDEGVRTEVNEAVAYARESPVPPESDLRRHVFM